MKFNGDENNMILDNYILIRSVMITIYTTASIIAMFSSEFQIGLILALGALYMLSSLSSYMKEG
ncbi:hypothetical protein D3C79_981020 [compost metagenome]